MSTINKRREALVDYPVKEIGIAHVKDFSESLRILGVCDLLDDEELTKVTTHGLIDVLVVLYKFGTINKLIEVRKEIKENK